MKLHKIVALALGMSMIFSSLAYAGTWEPIGTDWKYKNDDGSYLSNGWNWIDGKCYYFYSDGLMAKDTIVDGYQVNADGAWVVNGAVQTQTTTPTNNTGATANHNANYDPAHPLAGKIDEWNLRLPYNVIGPGYICSSNVQAMLTGQMDQYYAAPVGESVNPTTGTIGYVSQEDYDYARMTEQALYNWFCNWLNGMDFENMSEMDKAKEIQKVLAATSYDYDYYNSDRSNNRVRNGYYDILINGGGICSEYALTATALAKALGLKSSISGTGDHSVYYIQVDGVGYFGQNETLNLDTPTPDYVYFQ